jgi:hypothetical protein
MKKLIYLGIIICYLFLIAIISSCNSSYHLKKFYKKGGTIDTIERVIEFHDTIKGENGKDSIIIREVAVPCPEPVIETRWKTRYKYKTTKDSLKHERLKYIDSLKYALKTAKNNLKIEKSKQKTNRTIVRQENKKSKWWVWLLIGFFTPILLKRFVLPKMFQ